MSASPPLARTAVSVVVERRKATSAWVDHVWRPVAVLVGEPQTEPWTRLEGDDELATFFAGTIDMELHRTETSNYRSNLASGTPSLWVVMRPTGIEPPFEIVMVTADPSEGEALTEPGTDLVETVPMPEAIHAWVDAFIAEHHVERPFYKRQRDRADPNALGRRGRVDKERGS